MRFLLRALALVFVLLLVASAAARPSVKTLAERLEKGSDFRVRMGAALELGKRKDSAARRPLEKALGDENPAVRAAAAAALRVLGDRAAIPALERHAKDKSRAVRAQIKSTLAALRKKKSSVGKITTGPTVLVKLGNVSANKNAGSSKDKAKLLGQFKRASKKKLRTLPGVKVMRDSEDAASKARKQPVVMVTGRLRRAEMSKEGNSVVYSAKVEYVMHRMPERAIASLVSGSAQGRASSAVARDEKKLAQLRREVLTAAVASAMRRASEAIRAAVK